jgi:hypothetical protein
VRQAGLQLCTPPWVEFGLPLAAGQSSPAIQQSKYNKLTAHTPHLGRCKSCTGRGHQTGTLPSRGPTASRTPHPTRSPCLLLLLLLLLLVVVLARECAAFCWRCLQTDSLSPPS